jgi:hypothetical protein
VVQLFPFLKEGLNLMISLSHQRRVFEMSLALNLALNPGIVDLADFLGIEPSPFLIIKGPIERLYIPKVNKVDKGIAYITFIEKIDG